MSILNPMDNFPSLQESELSLDPISQFMAWFDAAKSRSDIRNPDAACLSTVSESGLPEGRMLLIKYIEDRRFIFFTNLGSPKVKSIRSRSDGALTFYWAPLGRQVRVSGKLSQVSRDFASTYFDSRPLDSKVGASVSKQSQPLNSRGELLAAVKAFKSAQNISDLKRPVFWSGFELEPTQFEFWQEGEYRLHDRFLYTKLETDSWQIQRLYP